MCGICLVLNIPVDNHLFNFDFFKSYSANENQHLPLNKHIIKNKLLLSNNFVPAFVNKLIGNRGPDQLKITQIDMFKTVYREIQLLNQNDQYRIQKGTALGIQSTLHLRGNKIYTPTTPGSFFLYNGQIWDTGSLTPIDVQNGQNDARWIHKMLASCKGNQQKMLQILSQIRGDFAIILIQADKLFIIKDYFGKRSLLVGMSDDHLIFSSVPIQHIPMKEELVGQNQDQESEESWKQKYEAQWLSSKNKNFFQVPNNSLISINLRNNEAMWQRYPIYQVNLKNIEKIPQHQQHILSSIKKLLIESVRELSKCIKGIQNAGNLKKQQKFKQIQQPKVAVLFSGGIDSTLIARMLDIVLPKNQPIDLINLAFRQDAPDRQAGKISYEELKSLNPGRKFNLILVNKTLNDIEGIKNPLIEAIYPKTTHMDFNIAAALHIASKQTKAKIIMTGLGADQIFSGYSRYRIAFKRAGYDQLQNQMIFDMERLWIRNLGRDDRAIAMNGKEVRYPFLYLPLWKYLRTIQINKLTQGTGQKILLRKVAREFGLQKASTFKKKAIQFGTRLAKLSNVKCFGSNRKAKGTYQFK